MSNQTQYALLRSILRNIRLSYSVQKEANAAHGLAPAEELVYHCIPAIELDGILERLVLPVRHIGDSQVPLTFFCELAKPDPGDVWTQHEKLMGPLTSLEVSYLSFPAARLAISKHKTVRLLELIQTRRMTDADLVGLPTLEVAKWRVYQGVVDLRHIERIDYLFWDGSWRSLDDLVADDWSAGLDDKLEAAGTQPDNES